MAEETTESTEETPAETGGGLRKQLESALSEVKELKADKMGRSFASLGLELDKGIGKAIAQGYEGDYSKESIAEYAMSEYEWEQAPAVDQHPQAAAIAQGHEQLEQVAQTAGSVAAPTGAESLAKAEAEGDWGTTMALKGEQVANMFRNQNPQTGR